MNSVVAGPLVLDLQALQNPDHSERGIGRYALEFTMALCEAHPDLVGAVRLNPDLPVPDAAGPLRAAGKLDPTGGRFEPFFKPRNKIAILDGFRKIIRLLQHGENVISQFDIKPHSRAISADA